MEQRSARHLAAALAATALAATLAAVGAHAQENCLSPGLLPAPGMVSGDTTGGRDDYDPMSFGCTGANCEGADHIYEYTPAANELVDLIATPLAPDFDISLWVFTDCSIPEASCIAGTDEFGAGTVEQLSFVPLTGGTTYRIVIDGFRDFLPGSVPEGPYTLELARSVVPDDCARARPVARLPSHDRLETTLATDQLDPPSCGIPPQPGSDIVYRLDPPYPVTVDVTLRPDPGFDASLYAVRQCAAAVCEAASDSAGAGGAESLSLPLVPGSPLFVVVDSAGAGGVYDIDFLAADTCAAPVWIDAVPFVADGDAAAANDDINLARSLCTGFRTRSLDVVYALSFPSDAYLDLEASTDDGAYDLALYVVRDCALPDDTCVAGADLELDGGSERIDGLYLLPGETLFAVIDSFNPFEASRYRLTVESAARVQLYMTKAGSGAVELRFAGRAPGYTILRDHRRDMAAPRVLTTSAAGPSFTDLPPGGASFYYRVE